MYVYRCVIVVVVFIVVVEVVVAVVFVVPGATTVVVAEVVIRKEMREGWIMCWEDTRESYSIKIFMDKIEKNPLISTE